MGARAWAQGIPSPASEVYNSLPACTQSDAAGGQGLEAEVSVEVAPVVVAEVADTDGSSEVAIDGVKKTGWRKGEALREASLHDEKDVGAGDDGETTMTKKDACRDRDGV